MTVLHLIFELFIRQDKTQLLKNFLFSFCWVSRNANSFLVCCCHFKEIEEICIVWKLNLLAQYLKFWSGEYFYMRQKLVIVSMNDFQWKYEIIFFKEHSTLLKSYNYFKSWYIFLKIFLSLSNKIKNVESFVCLPFFFLTLP